MAQPTLRFLSWAREDLGGLASTTAHGRAWAQTTVTLAGRDAAGDATTSETRTLAFLLAGPADVAGLKPGAVTGRYPAPGTLDAESDKCAHVEFADVTLPWRFSPAPNPAAGTGTVHPWLVLVVGIEGELTLAGDQVTLTPGVQALHPLQPAGGFPWAHVQIDESGRRVARVLSGRALQAGQDYVAVLVAAFDASGARAWTGTGPVTLPAYDVWRFRTAVPPGSFRDLAARLNPGQADPNTGRAPVDYPRVPTAPDLEIRGAVAPLGSTDAALPAAILADMSALASPAIDTEGRPIVGLPLYGDAWKQDPVATTWGGTLNTDPRHRGSGGLGLELGIRLQEELIAEARANAGALDVAAQRIADLVLGLMASTSLWARRLPSDRLRLLWTLGPALGRLVAENGTIADLATAADRALPAGIFSAAARRVLRPGPARSARLANGPADPADVLEAANRCPEPPKPTEDGIVVEDLGVRDFDARRERAIETGRLDLDAVVEGLKGLDLERVHPRLRDRLQNLVELLADAISEGRPAPLARAMELIIRALKVEVDDEEELRRLGEELDDVLERFGQLGGDANDLRALLERLEERPGKEPPCSPVDLAALASGVAGAFDPTSSQAPARVRVLATLDGLDPAQPLAPPEVCVGLDRPVWRDLSSQFAEWLLPGVGVLPEDSVIAVETNPIFTDALMTGYNTQLLAELRWRNIHVATGCTPLRVFWERADTGTGDRIDDIVGIAAWTDASALGDPTHRPGGASGRDLVLVFRGQLFIRYPRTLLYLVSAVHAGTPDFDQDPAAGAARALPTFQGRIGADVVFFGFQGLSAGDVVEQWVVLEEPPAGYRFYNTPTPIGDGATFARLRFADPVRVLIRGDSLVPGGGP